MIIGKRIADLRKANDITQLELAERLGVTDRAVSKWETGGSYPDITFLPKIADIFNISVDYLLRDKPQIKQRIDIFNAWNDKSFEKINNQFLDNGWKVIELKLTGDGDGGCLGSVVMEKEFYAE